MTFSVKRVVADIKSILREPVMLIFLIVPMFVLIIFKIFLPVIDHLLYARLAFNLSDYYIYLLVALLIISPDMMGTVTGFLMLDEKDWHVSDLMLVTPSGLFGYLMGRLIMPVILTVLYSIIGFLFFNIYEISVYTFLIIICFLVMETCIFSMILFSLAADKVQGLTYAKGLGLLMMPIFFGLIGNKILDIIAWFSPYYWVFEVVKSPKLVSILVGLIVHIIWLVVPTVTCIKKIYS